MKVNFLSLTLLLTATTTAYGELPVHDKDFNCISRQQAERYVSDFNINVASFGGLELCNGNVDSKKLFNDLYIVENGRFSGTKRNMFIREIIPTTSYFSWLKEQTAGVRRGHDMPTATAYNSGGYFTMQDGWAKMSTLGRVGTIIHEARHTEGYSHTSCRQGPYKDLFLAGCDSSLQQQGSHGVEMEYYSRVALQGENFHPAYQQMARLMNLGRANFVFNQNPMSQSEALVAQSGSEILVVDHDDVGQAVSLGDIEGFRLKRTSYGAALYKEDQALALDLYETDSTLLTDEYSYYKLLLSTDLEIVDMQEVDMANTRYLVALTKNGTLLSYIFGEGRWSSPVRAADVVALVTTSPDGQEGLFTVNQNGEVQSLHPTNLRRGQVLATWPESVIDFVNWNNQRLAVDQSGHVFEVTSGKSYLPMEKWQIKQLVRAPLYSAFERQ